MRLEDLPESLKSIVRDMANTSYGVAHIIGTLEDDGFRFRIQGGYEVSKEDVKYLIANDVLCIMGYETNPDRIYITMTIGFQWENSQKW